MFRFILSLLIVLSALSANKLKWDELDTEQKALVTALYSLGKPHGLELVLPAIAFQESRLGKHPINLNDPSCGVTHINLNTYIKLLKLEDSSFLRNTYCSELVRDVDLSASVSIRVLKYFISYHKGDISLAIKSYNAGFNYKSKRANAYLAKVNQAMQEIKAHEKDIYNFGGVYLAYAQLQSRFETYFKGARSLDD